jgi:hypothetical protein
MNAEKPSVGTMVELGWASVYGKPIVLVRNNGAGWWHDHPFIRHLCAFKTNTLDGGIELVKAILL